MKSGFTLIELSIVLVIIGLIAGGILTGRALIDAAAVRAQVSQIQQLYTAINAFRLKYNALPGDIPSSAAEAAGMSTRSGDQGRGNGDNRIDACNSILNGSASGLFGCESALFWNDLSVAGLVAGNYPDNLDTLITISRGQAAKYLPAAKLGDGNFISVFSNTGFFGDETCTKGIFCFALAHIEWTEGGIYHPVAAPVGSDPDSIQSATPSQAYSIDSKMDDGFPNTGKVLGSSAIFFIYTRTPDAPCNLVSGSNVTYNISGPQVDAVGCVMNFVYP